MFIDKLENLSYVIILILKDVREKYIMVRSVFFFYEILYLEVSKGNVVCQLVQLFGIEQVEVMCIGDNGNDLIMIEWVGCGVVMVNVILEVLEVVNF